MTHPATPQRIAHRGMPKRVLENTLASFALALTEGAQGIELDVHTTADGVVVVHHDPVIASGLEIARVTLRQLRNEPGPLGIPTLSEVLQLVDGVAELFVELKGANVEGAVMDCLDSYDGPVALHSFDHEMIKRAANAGCPWRLGLLTEEFVSNPAALLRAHGALDFWPHEPLVSPDVVRTVHGIRGRVIPWTVNDPKRMRELQRLEVDGICTDDVKELSEAVTTG